MALFSTKSKTNDNSLNKNTKNAQANIKEDTKKTDDNKEKKPSVKEKMSEVKAKVKEHRILESEIGKLVSDWKDIMGNCKIVNEELQTYALSHIQKEEKFGWSCRVYAPKGLPIQDLEKCQLAINSGLECQTIITIPEHNQFAMMKIIYPNLVKCNEIPFEPVKVKPYEIYVGVDVSGEPIIFNVNDTPQILIAGQNRKGKNGSVDHALISWICSCEPEEIELYLIQGAKNDFSKYEKCRQVRCYVEGNLDKTLRLLDHIRETMDKRTQLMKPMVSSLKGDNIFHYNKLHPHRKLPYVYVVIDEFIALMIDNKVDTDKEVKLTKGKIMNHLQSICQYGGALGVNVIILHQKPEKELCPSFVKNQCNIRICYGFEDEICCQIVLGAGLSKMAHKLPRRKAYYSNEESHGFLYTTNLENRREMFLRPHMRYDNRNIFDNMERAMKNEVQSNVTNIVHRKSSVIESDDGSVVVKSNKEENTTPTPKVSELEKEIENKKLLEMEKRGMEIKEGVKEEVKEEVVKEEIKEESKPLEVDSEVVEKPIQVPIEKPNMPTEQLDFSKVDPKIIEKKKKEVIANISKIPNYVPYNPNPNAVVIDKTVIDFSKTEKARIDKKVKEGEE